MCNNVHYTWDVNLSDPEKESIISDLKYELDHTLNESDLLKRINVYITLHDGPFYIKGVCTNENGILLNTFISKLVGDRLSIHEPVQEE